MATFSTSEAIGAGFGLIKRRPLSVLAWGLVYFLIAGLPALLMFAWIGPDYFSFLHQAMQGLAHPGQPIDRAALMPAQMKMSMMQPLLFVGSIVGRAMLAGAVFRAVLEPDNKSFASLRLGAQELWLGLLFLATGILMVVLIIVIAICGLLAGLGITAGLKAAHVQDGWIVFCAVILCLAAAVLVIWVTIRFALAGPMTFAEREFRLFESWSLTKGKAWKLFLMGLLITLVLLALGLVIEGSLAGVAFAIVGPVLFDHERMLAFFQQPPDVWFHVLAPWIVGFSLIGSFLAGAAGAISIAPWAVAYRELSGRG